MNGLLTFIWASAEDRSERRREAVAHPESYMQGPPRPVERSGSVAKPSHAQTPEPRCGLFCLPIFQPSSHGAASATHSLKVFPGLLRPDRANSQPNNAGKLKVKIA